MVLNSKPTVSVVIPMRDGERFVERTLRSALAQDYPDFEVIVVDDGSTDASAQIVERVAATDERVRLVPGDGSGVALARNLGIECSRAELIATLDHDDVWLSNKLGRQVRRFAACEDDVALVYTWSYLIDEDDRVLRRFRPFDERTMRTLEGWVFFPLLYKCFLTASSPLYRRQCLEAVGGFDTDAGSIEDWELDLRLAERYRFALVPDYLVGYRQHPAMRSSTHTKMTALHRGLLSRAAERHPGAPRALQRWARSEHLGSLVSRRIDAGDLHNATRYLARAVVLDPGLLLRAGPWEAAARRARATLHVRSTEVHPKLDLAIAPAARMHTRRGRRLLAKPFEWPESRRIRMLRALELLEHDGSVAPSEAQ